MRLSDLLSKNKINDYKQVDNFVGNRKPTVGQPRKLDVGKVSLNFYCKDCEDIRTFVSYKELSFVALSENMASIDAGLRCSGCDNNILPVWFIVNVDGDITSRVPKVGITSRMMKYTDKVSPSKEAYGDYSDLLDMAERAYQAGLGAGSMVYLRKLFEMITEQTALAVGITDIYKDNGRMKPFRQVLERVDGEAHIIPSEFANDGYTLFGELSDIVHGTSDENEALRKYTSLRRLVIGILDKIKNNRELLRNNQELLEAINNLGWNSTPSP